MLLSVSGVHRRIPAPGSLHQPRVKPLFGAQTYQVDSAKWNQVLDIMNRLPQGHHYYDVVDCQGTAIGRVVPKDNYNASTRKYESRLVVTTSPNTTHAFTLDDQGTLLASVFKQTAPDSFDFSLVDGFTDAILDAAAKNRLNPLPTSPQTQGAYFYQVVTGSYPAATPGQGPNVVGFWFPTPPTPTPGPVPASYTDAELADLHKGDSYTRKILEDLNTNHGEPGRKAIQQLQAWKDVRGRGIWSAHVKAGRDTKLFIDKLTDPQQRPAFRAVIDQAKRKNPSMFPQHP